MITSINKNNAARYTALFRDAEKAMSSEGILPNTITTLEDYFSVIKTLADKNRKYTILPLDEDYMSIDANSRRITVPESFKKNGIAVQGDEVAEIIYFKINRYFDATDLNTCDIFIQWEQISNTGANVQNGVSVEYVRDIESDPDYLIFGWPIDSRITELAGSIKFSVRFIKWTTDNKGNKIEPIVYSFSTLDATAIINPALDFDPELLVSSDEINRMILDRLVNTTTNVGGKASPPEFLVNLQSGEIDLADLDSDGVKEAILKVQAYLTGAGVLSYSWIKNGKESLTGDLVYEQVAKTITSGETTVPVVAKENIVYYEKIGENTYSPITTLAPGDNLTEFSGDIYQQFAELTINEVGKYHVVASNMVAGPEEGINTAFTISNVVEVPGPIEAKFVEADGETLTEINKLTMTKEENGDYSFAVSAKPTVDTHAANTYSWYKDPIDLNEPILTNSGYSMTITQEQATRDKQGLYQLKVTSERNNSEVTALSPGTIVTYPAILPIVEYQGTTGAYAYPGDTISINVSYGNNDYQISDYQTTTYQWYIDKTGGDIAINGANESTLTVTTNGQISVGDSIYCLVTNNYNGNIVSTAGNNLFVGNK